MSDLVVRNKAQREYLNSILSRYKEEIQNALPSHMNADRFIAVALIQITKKPYLFGCTKASIIGAIMTAASIGLYIDDELGECFIDRAHNMDTKKYEAQIIIGYQGLCVLAMRSGYVEYILPRHVYEGDEFEYDYGLDERLIHRPKGLNKSNDKITHFYVVVKLVSGSKIFNVMTRPEVEEARDRSPHYKQAIDKFQTAWGQFFNKMGDKTAFRSITKYIPLSPEMKLAINLDEMSEFGLQDLSKQVFDLPEVDDDILEEVLIDQEMASDKKKKDKAQAKTKDKVSTALADLSKIVSNKGK